MKVESLVVAAAAAVATIALPAATAFGVAPRSSLQQQQERVPRWVALEATGLDASTEVSASSAEAAVNPRLSGLAFALDEGTRKSHSMAENTAFVQGFFKGISSPDSYKNLLTSLYYVYRAMEVEVMDAVKILEKEDDDNDNDDVGARWIAALDVAALRRLEGLEKDMEYFYGSDWKTRITPPTKGTELYVGRIRELAASVRSSAGDVEEDSDDDETSSSETAKDSLLYLFVAHQYTRYLGDLFGGQMMGNMASRSMDLPKDGSGVAFYTFEGVDSTKDFITEWYTTLNALGVTPEQEQAIVDEANLVFELNIGILQELEGSPWAALWTMAVSGAKDFTDWSNIKESKNKQ